ncbi:helix-turn-helix domain-containing protein [Evansella halocellulosilytica]|uniref:helix-turn-helix domain-containing protein n=1 Tax=Evansella halocellulosilytica TaxID=2011013 RepID=UPI000BB8FD21|nr:helix-turn-helix transcriptional regulator [Evansella halocellulosilytica]
MSDDKIMIGDRLRHLINENNFDINRQSLIEDFGFNKSNLQKYLNNHRRPSIEDIVKLANLFNTSVDYLVQKTDFVMDTWDFDFFEELFNFSSNKIKQHFKDRQNHEIEIDDPIEVVLFGLITNTLITKHGKTLEDLTLEEIQQHEELSKQIINIFMASIYMVMNNNSDNKEIDDLINQLTYSIEAQQITHEPTKEEQIKVLKSYLNQNIENGQKVLKMLEELEQKD